MSLNQKQKLDPVLEQKQRQKMEEAKTLKKVEVQSDDPKLKAVVKERLSQIVKEARKKTESSKNK